MEAKERMLRFVVGPRRALVADLKERMPGRGIWLSAERDVIETARASPRLARAAGGPVAVPVDLVARLEAGLVERLTELLSAARRAGRAASQEQAHVWLAQCCVGLWLEAEGGCVSGAGLAEGAYGSLPVCVPSAVLDAVFGGEVGSVAVRRGRVSEAVRVTAGRLAAVRYGLVQARRGQTVA